jgi:hypothetical protein
MPSLLLKPVPHTEAARFIASKPIFVRQAFDHLLPDLKARAFTITGVESANVMQSVRDRIAELPQGADWDEVKRDVAGRISPWLEGKQAVDTPDSAAASTGAADRRAELLLRTHGFESYAAAAEEVGERQRDAFPYCQYLTADDDRVRDSHAALDGIVLPADHPFWETHTGPWEWGCRCLKVWLTREDVADLERQDARKPPEARRVLSGERLKAIGENRLITTGEGGVPRFVDVGPSGTFTFNPKTLKLDAGELRGRYEPEVWNAFEQWARNQQLDGGANVLEWLGAKPSTPAAPAALSSEPSLSSVVPQRGTKEETDFALAASTVANERAAIQEATYRSEKVLGGGVNQTVVLTNGRKVVFKPSTGEHQGQLRRGVQPGTQYLREAAASVLDEQLGLGLVPATTLLTRGGVTGSAQLFQEGFRPAFALRAPYRAIAKLPDRVLQDWQLFDDLAGHLDRHMGNFMLRVTGDRAELALIDNGLSFSTIAQAKRFPGPREGMPIDNTNLQRLRSLLARRDEITTALQPYLERSAVDLLFARAQTLLEKGIYGDTD